MKIEHITEAVFNACKYIIENELTVGSFPIMIGTPEYQETLIGTASTSSGKSYDSATATRNKDVSFTYTNKSFNPQTSQNHNCPNS